MPRIHLAPVSRVAGPLAISPEQRFIFHGERLKPLQLERELPGGASGAALQQLGGLDYPVKIRDVVPDVVVRAEQPVSVAEHDEYLLLPLEVHYLLDVVVQFCVCSFGGLFRQPDLLGGAVLLTLCRIGGSLTFLELPF